MATLEGGRDMSGVPDIFRLLTGVLAGIVAMPKFRKYSLLALGILTGIPAERLATDAWIEIFGQLFAVFVIFWLPRGPKESYNIWIPIRFLVWSCVQLSLVIGVSLAAKWIARGQRLAFWIVMVAGIVISIAVGPVGRGIWPFQ